MPEGMLPTEFIPKERKKEYEERTPVQDFISALEKSEQIAREGSKQIFLEADQPFYVKPFLDILAGKRSEGEDRYSEEEFREDIYRKLGVDQPETVEKDWPQWGKTGADLLTDMVFNVDNLVFGLPGKLAGRLGKAAIPALKSAEITKGSRLLKTLSDAKPENIARTTTGAALGAMMTQEDDDALDVVKKMTLGGLAGRATVPITKLAGKVVGEWGGGAVDAFNRNYRPNLWENIQRLMKDVPLDERTGTGGTVGINDLVKIAGAKQRELVERNHFYKKGLQEIEQGLTNEEIKIYDSLRLQGAGMSKKLRGKYERDLKKKISSGRRLTRPEKNAILNEANKITNSTVSKELTPLIYEMDPTGNVVKAMNKFVKHNKNVIKDYNKTVKATGNPYIVGFDYYMPSILPDIAEFTEKLKKVKGGFKKLKTTTPQDLSKLSRGEIRQLAADNYTRAFLSDRERTARTILAKLNNVSLNTNGTKFVDGFLEDYDRFQRVIVTGQLFQSLNWITTNYLDNLARAYMVAGTAPAFKMAVGGAAGLATAGGRVALENRFVQSVASKLRVKPAVDVMSRGLERLSKVNLVGEIMEASHPLGVGKAIYDDQALELAHILGVMDTDKIRNFLQHWDDYGGLRMGANKQKEIPATLRALENYIAKNEGNALAAVGKVVRKGGQGVHVATKLTTDFLSDTFARVGTVNEVYTKVKTFEHVYKSLLKESPEAYKAVKKMGAVNAFKQGVIPTTKGPVDFRGIVNESAQIIEDAFFDYSKVSAFEKAVAKRVVPFWTYHTRSSGFWLKALTDPERIGRAVKAARLVKGIGRPLNERERKQVDKWQLGKGARLVEYSDDGRMIVASIPSYSMFEAMRDLSGAATAVTKPIGLWPDTVRTDRLGMAQKLSPIIKTVIELIGGKEIMTGQPSYPSEYPDRQKRVYSDALATRWLLDFPLMPYKPKIYVDKKHNTWFVEDDTDAAVMIVRRNLLPMRALESVLATQEDVKSGKRTLGEALLNYFSPIKVKGITAKQRIDNARKTEAQRRRGIRNRMKRKELE